MIRPALKIPIYDATVDGNVFKWLIGASQDFRKIRQRERFVALEKLMDTHKDGNVRNQRI